MKRTLQIAVLGGVLGLMLEASPVFAYCRTTTCEEQCEVDSNGCFTSGLPVAWASTCVGFSLNSAGTTKLDPQAMREAVRASFAAWSEVACANGTASLKIVEADAVACHASEYSTDSGNANIVMFDDHDWPYSSGMDTTLAITTVTFNVDTGEIYDADMEINAVTNDLTVGDTGVVFDLQSIVTHEAGHFIGLAHSPVAGATMEFDYAAGSTSKRQLSQDDRDGACAVYPPGRAGTCDSVPRHGFSSECAAGEAHPGGGGCCRASSSRSAEPDGRAIAVAVAVVLGLALRRRTPGSVTPTRRSSRA